MPQLLTILQIFFTNVVGFSSFSSIFSLCFLLHMILRILFQIRIWHWINNILSLSITTTWNNMSSIIVMNKKKALMSNTFTNLHYWVIIIRVQDINCLLTMIALQPFHHLNQIQLQVTRLEFSPCFHLVVLSTLHSAL